MTKATTLRVVLILVGFLCIGAVCELRVLSLKARHQAELRRERKGLEVAVAFIAEDLAEHQAKVGHATYLVAGLPLADESRYGYPVLNLGCIGDAIRFAFVNAYDSKLEMLAGKDEGQVAQPLRAAEAVSRHDGREGR